MVGGCWADSVSCQRTILCSLSFLVNCLDLGHILTEHIHRRAVFGLLSHQDTHSSKQHE
jgi:hypothetical protein